MRIALILAALLALAPRLARAEPSVPLDLQVDLLRKLVRFERGFVGRVGSGVSVVIVVRPTNRDSSKASTQLHSELQRIHDIAGHPIQVTENAFTTFDALKSASSHAAIVLITPGLEHEIHGIAAAFADLPVITVAIDGERVVDGAVIGFELVSSKPKISLNLGQARRQRLDFDSELLRLAKVIP